MSHEILPGKLDHYSIRGISNNSLRSYLSDRSQFVSINDVNFGYKTVEYGVPQHLNLGPSVFFIPINDLNIAVKHFETSHFANNSLLNIKGSAKQINKVVNKDLKFLF